VGAEAEFSATSAFDFLTLIFFSREDVAPDVRSLQFAHVDKVILFINSSPTSSASSRCLLSLLERYAQLSPDAVYRQRTLCLGILSSLIYHVLAIPINITFCDHLSLSFLP
jgi:hypothetical protein